MNSVKEKESETKPNKLIKKQNSTSTREDVSKQALRLQNFKKKISNHRIFENKTLLLDNKTENNKRISDDIELKNKFSQSERTGNFQINDPNLTFGSLRGVIVPEINKFDNLKKKFQELKLSMNEKLSIKNQKTSDTNESINYSILYF